MQISTILNDIVFQVRLSCYYTFNYSEPFWLFFTPTPANSDVHGRAGETDVQVCWHVSRDMVCCGSITIFWKWVLFVESVVQVFWLVEVLQHTLGRSITKISYFFMSLFFAQGQKYSFHSFKKRMFFPLTLRQRLVKSQCTSDAAIF